MIVEIQKASDGKGWQVFQPRANVSATVWERIPGFADRYATAREAIFAAATRYDAPSDSFRRIVGRGSARYRLQMAGGIMPNGSPMTARDVVRSSPTGKERYGYKRDYPKIHIYDEAGNYLATTTWAESCREAVARHPQGFKAHYAK